jgi:hypothetical protein
MLRDFSTHCIRLISVGCGEPCNALTNVTSECLGTDVSVLFSFCFGAGFGGACAEEWINTVISRVDCRIRNSILFTQGCLYPAVCLKVGFAGVLGAHELSISSGRAWLLGYLNLNKSRAETRENGRIAES